MSFLIANCFNDQSLNLYMKELIPPGAMRSTVKIPKPVAKMLQSPRNHQTVPNKKSDPIIAPSDEPIPPTMAAMKTRIEAPSPDIFDVGTNAC